MQREVSNHIFHVFSKPFLRTDCCSPLPFLRPIHSIAGWLNNAAVASRRYGEYLLELKEPVGAAMRLKDAVKYFNEWGAIRASELLCEKHAKLFSEYP